MKEPRRVHFGEDPADGRAACGATSSYISCVPDEVTCARGGCRRAADAHREELRALAARAGGATLVFLDFDGVLNHAAFARARTAAREGGDGAAPGSFDPACVARLSRLLGASGALVVVSSTWRIGATPRRLARVLGGFGFNGTIICMTPERPGLTRGGEIRAWLDALPTPPRSFVVIDDAPDLDGVEHAVVRTDYQAGGLTEEKVEAVLRLLGGARDE
jgi:hypothetical protein